MFSRFVSPWLAWFFVTAVALSYMSYLIGGNIVNAQASGATAPVVIRDEVQANSHQLSGMVMVQSPCDQLSVKTQALSATDYELLFTTWREPSVACKDDPTPRAFRTILFAPPTGVYFIATLDDVALPIAVISLMQDATP